MFGNDPSISTLKKHLWSIDYNLFFFEKPLKFFCESILTFLSQKDGFVYVVDLIFGLTSILGDSTNSSISFQFYNLMGYRLLIITIYCISLMSIVMLPCWFLFLFCITFYFLFTLSFLLKKIYIIFWSQFLLPQLLPDPSHLTTHPVPYSLFLCVCRKQTNIFPQINLVFFLKKKKHEKHTQSTKLEKYK